MTTATEAGLVVWHFAADRLRDGRPLPKRGDTLTHDGDVRPCGAGLHGSVRALDALSYAPGFMVARCELRGTLIPHENNKHAASERHYLTDYVDARSVIVAWALGVADKAVRVDAVKALRSAADSDGMPDEYRATLRLKADDLERLPVVDSSAAAWAARDAARAASAAAGAASAAAWAASAAAWDASDAAGAASDAAWAARDAAWDASAAACAARDAEWDASNAAWNASDAAWAASSAAWNASDAAGAASAAAWAARDAAWAASAAESNARLEAALTELLAGRLP